MECITVEASVICPTHQQIIGYMTARHWHPVGQQTTYEDAVYTRWQKEDQQCFVDVCESPECVDYYLRQKDAIELLADYDHWLDAYSLVEQLLKGGIIGQAVIEDDEPKATFSDTGVSDGFSKIKVGGFWQAIDPMTCVV